MANNIEFQIIGVAAPDADSPSWRVTVGWWNTDSDTDGPPDFTIIKTVDATSKEQAENTIGAEALEEQKELNAGDDPNPFGGDDDDDDDDGKDDGDDGDDNSGDDNGDDGGDDGGDGGGDPSPGTSVPPKEPK